jgi:hypothetical protein
MSYEVKGYEDKVLKLTKALYGLKQSLRLGIVVLMVIS